VPARPSGLGQQRHEPLDPAVDRDVIDIDAPFGQQLLDVTAGQAEAQVQRTVSTITSDGKQKPEKAERVAGA
jgi:hypothetical protein